MLTKTNQLTPPWREEIESINYESIREQAHRFCVVIPTLNEVHTIGVLVDEVSLISENIVVVDGGSSDGTLEILKEKNIETIFDNGKGKGDAIRVAIDKLDYEFLIFIDADLSHNPEDIPRLLSPLFNNKCEHVIASRPRGGSDELHGDFNKFMRMIGSDIITLGINYRFNVRLTDSQNGFRASKRKSLKELNLKENITTIEQEITIKAVKNKHRILEVPCKEWARTHGTSHIVLRKVSFRYIYSWLKYLFF